MSDNKSKSVRRNSLELLAPGAFSPTEKVQDIPLDSIVPNPFQVRKEFSEESIQELANSILENGLMQPILVRALSENKYEIVAGERRWRAHKKLNKTTITGVVREIPDEKMRLLALLENIQREDLSVIDKANGINELRSEFRTLADIGKALGMTERAIRYYLRIAEMPQTFKDFITTADIDFATSRKLTSIINKIQDKTQAEKDQILSNILEFLKDSSQGELSSPSIEHSLGKNRGGDIVSPPPSGVNLGHFPSSHLAKEKWTDTPQKVASAGHSEIIGDMEIITNPLSQDQEGIYTPDNKTENSESYEIFEEEDELANYEKGTTPPPTISEKILALADIKEDIGSKSLNELILSKYPSRGRLKRKDGFNKISGKFILEMREPQKGKLSAERLAEIERQIDLFLEAVKTKERA